MRLCTVDGCDKKHLARGLCGTHYNQRHQPERHKRSLASCSYCDASLLKFKAGARLPFCDYTCRDLYGLEHKVGAFAQVAKPNPKPMLGPKTDTRSPMRRAYESGDHAALLAAIKTHCEVRANGCWEWQRSLKKGYPIAFIGSRSRYIHRLSLEAKLRKPLGKQAAHHACANTKCVNPHHLQAITARENVAEMLARNYMESRIRDLEAALALSDPAHPLLREVGIARAA